MKMEVWFNLYRDRFIRFQEGLCQHVRDRSDMVRCILRFVWCRMMLMRVARCGSN